MQLSTDLPSGFKAVQNYIATRGETRLPSNVSKEADAAYMSEKGLRAGVAVMKGWPVGICSRCSKAIHNASYVSQSEPGEFCSKECRTAKQPAPRGGRPYLTAKQREQSDNKRLEYQKDLMRNRRGSALAKNPFQPIENTALADATLPS